MRTLKPQDYLDEVYPGAGISTKTVINWIKRGEVRGKQTVTGRWLVLVNEKETSKVSELVQMMEASGI